MVRYTDLRQKANAGSYSARLALGLRTGGHSTQGRAGGCRTSRITEISLDSKVAEQDSSFTALRIGKQRVGGLDVAVRQIALMRVVERTGYR